MLLVLLLVLPVILAGPNLLHNPGFESGTNSWECVDCSGSISSDKRSGAHSFKVSGRHHDYSGASQTISTKGGQYYYFKTWIKILNTANGKWNHDLTAMVDLLDNTNTHTYKEAGRTNYAFPGRWYLVGGDVYIPNNVKSVRLYVQVKETGVHYVVDDAYVDVVDYLTYFAHDADQTINYSRKADLSISLAGNTNPSGLQVEVQQTSSEFGWGSAVDANMIVDSNHHAYQHFFYNLFEWAVLENACKWRGIEPQKGRYNYNTPERAVNSLEGKGITMRGHNIFWGGPRFVPSWQTSLSSSQLRLEIVQHINGMTNHFKGKFKHWDVNNENLHLHFYEDRLRDRYITQYMFRETHKLDPSTQNYLNDYNLVASGSSTMAIVDQAYWFKASGVPLHGIGVQSHFDSYVDVSVVKRRLDEIAATGLPIWVTELDISEPNEQKKAQKYEDLLRLFFSHPAVEGVMFWGFWDGRHWRPEAALANGNNVTSNAAGRKVKDLLKHTWRTNEKHNINKQHAVKVHGFKGSYKLIVHHNGRAIHTQNFYLGSNGQNLKINLSGSGSKPNVDHVIVG